MRKETERPQEIDFPAQGPVLDPKNPGDQILNVAPQSTEPILTHPRAR